LNIDLYIAELLYQFDRIVIPGLGAFIARYQPAFINNESNIIYPPRRKIIFSEDFKKDNGILAEYIAQKNNLSTEEAINELNVYCKNKIETLEKYGKVEFAKLGNLIKDNDRIIFKPEYKGNYLLQAQGMSEIKIEPKFSDKPLINKDQIVRKTIKKTYSRKPLLKRVLIYSAFGLVVILVLFYIDSVIYTDDEPLYYYENQFPKPESNTIDNIDKAIADQYDKKSALAYNETKITSNNQPHTYHIIAGSFNENINAEKLKNELFKKGFKAYVINSNGKYRVAVKSYSSKNDAISELDKFKKYLGNAIWVLEE
jgi:hypothetical protein